MKKLHNILLIVFVIVTGVVSAQHDIVPYQYSSVKKEIIKIPGYFTEADYGSITADQKIVQLQYFDPHGRPLVLFNVRASHDQKDIVQLSAYDKLGRNDSLFLPYKASTSDGTFPRRGQLVKDMKQFYLVNTDKVATDSYPFGVSVFENSPGNFMKEQGTPGLDGQPGSTHNMTRTMTSNGANQYRIWRSTLTSTAYYAAGSLIIEEITDQNGNKVISVNDKAGRLLEKHVQSGVSTWLKTLFIYDDLGRIAYVLQPKGVSELAAGTTISAALVNRFAFSFVYDTRGRVVEKKTPGAAPVYYGYDPLDRLVLAQDGNLRMSNKWMYVKYDNRNRPVMQGIYTNATQTTRNAVQGLLDALVYTTGSTWYEKRQAGGTLNYTNQSFPTSGTVPLTANYYDTYDLDNVAGDEYSYVSQGISGEGTQFKGRGQLTATKTLILGSNPAAYLASYIFYDDRGRVIQVRSNNHIMSAFLTLSTNVYNFDGTLKHNKVFHKAFVGQEVVVDTRMEYDHMTRPYRVYQKINSGAEGLITEYEYNDLGQLVDKKLHNTGGSNFLQSVDYRYSIEGWLRSINNSQLSSNDDNDETNDLFGLELIRNTDEIGLSNTKFYNGNISAIKWKGPGVTSGADDQRSYKFTYDKSDRLLTSTFQAKSGGAWTKEASTLNENMTYDANGNILTLTRSRNLRGLSGTTVTSAAESIDNLTYQYAFGNRLKQVEDAAAGTPALAGFLNQVNSANTKEFAYDSAGSVTMDKNKGIDSVKYNDLGKVARIKFTDGRFIVYNYDGAGNKIRMRTYSTAGVQLTKTDYIGGFVYQDDNLSFFSSHEGRVVMRAAFTFERQYALKDHQGNTRVVFSSLTPAAANHLATFEGDAGDGSAQFQSVVAGNVVSFAAANHTTSGVKVVRMNQTYKIGPSKSIKVYPGDKIDIEVWEYHEGVSGFGTSTTPIGTLITSVATAFGGVSGGGGESGMIYNGVNTGFGAFGAGGNQGDARPAAYLNFIIFDKDYKVLDMGWQVAPNTTFTKQKISFPQKTIKEAGYVFTWLSYDNSSNNWVYFDDFKITHTKTNVIQYNEYYPFGLQTAASWTREGVTGNNYLYNGGSELNPVDNLYEMFYRGYDPALGRMFQVDPLATDYAPLSPYNYSFNNPVLFNDPLGDAPRGFDNDDTETDRGYGPNPYNEDGREFLIHGSSNSSNFGYNDANNVHFGFYNNVTFEGDMIIVEETDDPYDVYYRNGVIVGYSTRNSITEGPNVIFIRKNGMVTFGENSVTSPETPSASQQTRLGDPFANPGRWTMTAQAMSGFFQSATEIAINSSKPKYTGPINWANQIKAGKNLTKKLGVLGLGVTVLDAGVKGEWKAHHTVDMAIGIATTFIIASNPVTASIVGAYFLVDLGVQLYSGKSITEHIFD